MRAIPGLVAVLIATIALGARASEPASPAAPTADFSVEASRPAPNDLAVAVVYVEQGDADPARLAREVNRMIAAALETARSYPEIKLRSGPVSTYPVYGEGSPGSSANRIEAWRMRSEIRLESGDLARMSQLIGKLQASGLALAQVSMEPAPQTRRKVVDEATLLAIKAFEERAALISGALGKRYRIRQINVSDAGMRPPMYARMRAAPAAEASFPAPLEGGESEVAVTVNGSIELTD